MYLIHEPSPYACMGLLSALARIFEYPWVHCAGFVTARSSVNRIGDSRSTSPSSCSPSVPIPWSSSTSSRDGAGPARASENRSYPWALVEAGAVGDAGNLGGFDERARAVADLQHGPRNLA